MLSKSPIDETKRQESSIYFIAVLSGSESNLKKFKGEGYDKVLLPS